MELTNKEKISKFSKSMVTVTKVGRILAIVGIVFCAVGLAFIAYAAISYDTILEYVRANQDSIGNTTIELGDSGNVMAVLYDKITLLELVENKDLAVAAMEDAAVDCFGGLISCIITVVLMNIIQRIFVKLETIESPFSAELNKELKESFIGITLLVLVNSSFVVALIVGLTLLVVYYLYQYGTTLQKDVDQTI